MRRRLIRERLGQEKDVASAWWKLSPETELCLADGRRCILLYSGQPGGSAGPDVRDAVLRVLPLAAEGNATAARSASASSASEETGVLTGDVEFHLRASDWFAHGHQRDPRYNRVILHVVHFLNSPAPTRRQDGSIVPTCSLLDLPSVPSVPPALSRQSTWPCQSQPPIPGMLTLTLLTEGLRRFSEKSAALALALDTTPLPPDSDWSLYDACLLPALAEGLGYGRDRAFFRAAGLRLLGLHEPLPEPLGRASEPCALDASRLRILRLLIARWLPGGAWSCLRPILASDEPARTTIAALQAAFQPLSKARSSILLANVLLPFAAAVATRENTPALSSRAQHLYLAQPALPSNYITRLMTAQLQLPAEPERAVLQQGLHAIYHQTCRAKQCQHCPIPGQANAANARPGAPG